MIALLKLTVLLTAAPLRRRGRRYRDNLLDNLEADQPDSRQQTLRQPQVDPRRQLRRRVTDTPTSVPDSGPSSPADTADEGIGWGEGEGGVPDDWGWGLDNPTLAAATGSYKTELAQNGKNGRGSRANQPVTSRESTHEDHWDSPELEGTEEEGWDEAAAAAGDDTADRTPDVTVLDSTEVVSKVHLLLLHKLGTFLTIFAHPPQCKV